MICIAFNFCFFQVIIFFNLQKLCKYDILNYRYIFLKNQLNPKGGKIMEMKFYEKIGVRQWKKFVLWLMAQVIRNPKDRKGSNYYLAAIDLKAVKKFRKMLLLNGLIHAWGLFCVSLLIHYILENNVFSFSMLILIICGFLINLYCVILQRYNWLRIKKVLKKVARN